MGPSCVVLYILMQQYHILRLGAHVVSHRTALGSSRVLLVLFGPCWHYLGAFWDHLDLSWEAS